MSRISLLLGLCAGCLSGCASVMSGSPSLGFNLDQAAGSPEPGSWCILDLRTERTGLMASRSRRVTGHVEAVDHDFVTLTEVMEEQSDISGPKSFQRVPYLSRLRSATAQGVQLLDLRLVSRDQIEFCHPITADDAKSARDSLIHEGDKLVRPRVGIDFDFNVDR